MLKQFPSDFYVAKSMRDISVNPVTRIPDDFFCQILVVVGDDDKLAEVLALMQPPRKHETLVKWKRHHHTFFFGLLGGVCAAATCCPGDVLLTAYEELKPVIIASVGTAFGADRYSQRLGDVLVPKSVLVYEPNQSPSTSAFHGNRFRAT